MKTLTNICKQADELIIDRAVYFERFRSGGYPSCLGSQGRIDGARTQVRLCVSRCVRVSRYVCACTVCFPLPLPQAARRMSHLCMCPLSACRALGSAQLLRWKCHTAEGRDEGKKQKTNSCRATYHPKGVKCTARILRSAVGCYPDTVLLERGSVCLLSVRTRVTEGS